MLWINLFKRKPHTHKITHTHTHTSTHTHMYTHICTHPHSHTNTHAHTHTHTTHTHTCAQTNTHTHTHTPATPHKHKHIYVCVCVCLCVCDVAENVLQLHADKFELTVVCNCVLRNGGPVRAKTCNSLCDFNKIVWAFLRSNCNNPSSSFPFLLP